MTVFLWLAVAHLRFRACNSKLKDKITHIISLSNYAIKGATELY